MALKKILPADLEGKGVKGQPDTPGLDAAQMQEKVEEIVRTVVIAVFNQNAENTYDKAEVTAAIEAKMQAIGAGDMAKATYDPTNRQEDIFALVPPGVIMPYAGANSPTGFLLCNGAAVSRNVYARLFHVIGTTFGAGDGSATFNLPDIQGRVPLGADSIFTFGSTGGQTKHKHLNSFGFDASGLYGVTDAENLPIYGSEVVKNTNRSQISAQVSGGDARIAYTAESSTLQPYIAVNYIIKY